MKSLNDKVFDKIEKKWNIHICRHNPKCDGLNENFVEGFTYSDFKLVIEDIVKFTTEFINKAKLGGKDE